MRIIFTGTQSTGKSTVLHYFRDKGYPCITEVVRNLSKQQGIAVNQDGDEESQRTIFNTYYDLLTGQDGYFSDRGLTDVVAYTAYLHSQGKVSQQLLDEQKAALNQFHKNYRVLYIYFPIEFGVVDDGFRSTDEEFRSAIDKHILDLLKECEIPYIKVTGSVDNRIKLISAAMMLG